MNNWLPALIICTAIVASNQSASAAELSLEDASTLLAGKTWRGANADEQRFWFYHDGDGTFRARFLPGYGGKTEFAGKWYRIDAKVCWAWDGWETFCYVAFEYVGQNFRMTRTDGVVQSGILAEGNTEGL